ncbi:GNAT family N-acetyltransferase [Myroides injenensis]|uniref:GNAT family N-acetyltransferase n=1 Tax=Myroides injenensis TaxID=1183151 RepID=UPI000287AF0B|nr:GNAT family N-acetyltransferase [Myroides injenensis]
MNNQSSIEDEIYHFEKVSENNIHLIAPLAEKIWQKTYSSIISQEQIAFMLPMMYSNQRISDEISKGYIWKILFDGTTAIGYIDYVLEEDNRVFLSKIYLDTQRQQKGLGRILLQEVIRFAKDREATAIYLTVNKQNEKAINFYKRNNFHCIKSETFDIGNGYVMDDYIYQLDL